MKANGCEPLTSVLSVFVVQAEVISKVVADLTDKIKEHPFDVMSLEYSSKLTVFVTVRQCIQCTDTVVWCHKGHLA